MKKVRKILVLLLSLTLVVTTSLVFAEENEEQTQPEPSQEETQQAEEQQPAQTEEPQGNEQEEAAPKEETSEKEKPKENKAKQVEELQSKSAILYCDNTGEVILSKDANTKIMPIDMAKMVTVLLAVQKLPIDKEITVSEKAVGEKGNNLGLSAGEVVTAQTLIYGTIFYGSHDCTYTLAEAVSGSSDEFVKLMNETVKNLGCRNTVFKSLYGDSFDSEKSYTTAKDMLAIGKVIMSDKTLGTMMQQKKHKVKKTDKFVERKMERTGLLFTSADSLVKGGMASSISDNEGIAMVYFENNGLKLIGILDGKGEESLAEDARALLEIGKKKVKGIKVVNKGENVGKARIKHGAKTRINGYTEAEGMAYLPKEGSKSLLTTKVVMKSDLDAPIKKGQLLGTYQIFIADEMVNEVNIVSNENVSVGWFPSYIGISNRVSVIIVIVICLFILLLIVRAVNKAKSRKRREKMRKRKIQNEALARFMEEKQNEARSYQRNSRW